MVIRKRAMALLLALVAAVVVATTANAAQKEPKVRESADVLHDIKDGKARKVKTEQHTTGVWDGCKFHYLKSKATTYLLDEGATEASVHEDPEPLPPRDKDCVGTRNPTRAEMDEMEARVAEANPYTRTPGAPPPAPLPPDRYRGTP